MNGTRHEQDGGQGSGPGFFPDGLDERVIDLLIAEAGQVAGVAAEPTSALVDGTAAERRRRRIERRALAAVVRVLPARPDDTGADIKGIEDIAS